MSIDVRNISPTAQRQILGKVLAAQKSKYKNKPSTRIMPNGKRRTFQSQKEERRYDELVALLRAGKIRNLRLQQTFTLQESYVTAEGETVRALLTRRILFMIFLTAGKSLKTPKALGLLHTG